MTELKTLKELGYEMSTTNLMNGEQGKTRCYDMEELRQEAIKWAKEMDIYRSEDYCNGQMDFIMNFFNLTEEDI